MKKKNIILSLILIGVMCALPLSTHATPSSFEAASPSSVGDDAEETPSNVFKDYWWAFAAGGAALALLTFGYIRNAKKKTPAAAAHNSATAEPIPVGNAHHIGARESQQDSFVISDVSNAVLRARKGILGVVADGMGGMADGAEASAIVSRTMLQYFNEVESSGQPELDLLNMLYAANENINRFMQGREKGGSTVVAVIIRGGLLYWISVGDSRIYLYRNGALTQINREHTYAVELDEKAAAGEILWEEAIGHAKRTALTSYLGIGKLEKVDRNIHATQLLSGDRVILMSDGVFGVLTDDEILETMTFAPQESAVRLQEAVLAKQNPYQDNLTAIIFEYRGM